MTTRPKGAPKRGLGIVVNASTMIDGHEWIVTGGGHVLRDSMRVSHPELRALPEGSAVRRWIEQHRESHGVRVFDPQVVPYQVTLRLSPEAHAVLYTRCKDQNAAPSQVIERMLVPRGGRPAGSHGVWDPLMRALRTQVRAADELEISRATLNRWLSGESEPDERASDRIRRVAKSLKVPSPV